MAESGAFGNRFILFLDFLGTSAAIREWPPERLRQFADLLNGVRNLQRAETINGATLPDGRYQATVTPEISTFSDHIAISYGVWPTKDGGEHMSHIQPDLICLDLIRYISDIAAFALSHGLLVRGAICFGDLYHKDGVVVGQAMIDAYRMESKEAIVPRILVSDQVAQMVGSPEDRRDLFLRDADGLWHLNYFKNLVRHAADQGYGDPNMYPAWKARILATIDAEISAILVRPKRKVWRTWLARWPWLDDHLLNRTGARDRKGKVAKWLWFRERFIEATAHIQDL